MNVGVGGGDEAGTGRQTRKRVHKVLQLKYVIGLIWRKKRKAHMGT